MANGLKKPPAAQPPPPPDLVAQAVAVVAQHTKLVAAKQAAEARVLEFEATVATARTALADAEAQRFADGLPLGDDTEQAVALNAAQEQLRRAKSLVEGLHRNLQSSDVQLLSSHEALNHHRKQHAEAVVLDFVKTTLRPAAQAYAATLAKAKALHEALGVTTEGRDPQDTLDYHLTTMPAHDWQRDKEAKALFQEHSALRSLSDQMKSFRRDAETRLRVSERSRSHRANFNPEGTYIVARRFTCYGKEFVPGDRVDKRTIHLRLLATEYEMRNIKLLTEDEA
jgi:hypothetical protein